MYSSQIDNIVKSDPLMRRFWLGVYSRDNIPQLPAKTTWGLIANTESMANPGQHWIGLYSVCEGSDVIFLDPLAQDINTYGKEFEQALKDFNVITLDKPIQNDKSVYCAAYCLMFYYYLLRDVSLCSIVDTFCSETIYNDAIVRDFFATKLSIHLKIKIK